MSSDWSQLVEAFTLGAFPWISQLKQLKIHFEVADLDVAAIFNFFASLFALGIYGYFVYAHPTQVVDLPHWYVFLASAVVMTVIFFGNFIWQRERVSKGTAKWPMLVGFVLYLGIFSTLTAGFGILRILGEYVIIEGVVVDIPRNTPVAGADVQVETSQSDKSDKYERSTITDQNGHFSILVDKPKFADLTRYIVSKTGYQEKQVTFSSGFSAASTMKRIELPQESEKGK